MDDSIYDTNLGLDLPTLEDANYEESTKAGRHGYDVMFKHNRVDIGKAIDINEFARRLAYELQIPNRFGIRVIKAVNRVISDAARHGEGVQFHKFGTIKLGRYNTPLHRMPDGKMIERESMFKVTFSPHTKLKESLASLTHKYYD